MLNKWTSCSMPSPDFGNKQLFKSIDKGLTMSNSLLRKSHIGSKCFSMVFHFSNGKITISVSMLVEKFNSKCSKAKATS